MCPQQTKALCLQLVKECWESLTAEIIQKSFVCVESLSRNTDGMEDEEIHCLKEGGVAADARETLPRLPLQWIANSRDVEEDEDELEGNEPVLDDC